MPVSRSRNFPHGLSRTPVATAVLLALASPALMAQEPTTLGEVTVTAQKRAENLQNVPISLATLNTKTLEELHVQNFKDYVNMLPSVSMQPGLGAGSGFSAVYMRGVATGADGQATTSQPSVGMYLDEQPITTIQGNLDIHLYDIARVEALAGPQGTLYGASSQSGTIRIITNKPDLSGFASGYSLEGNIVDGEDSGYVAEGFVNVPIGEKMAIRLVGWAEHDAGWIDNVAGTRTFPGDASTTADDYTVENSAFVEKNYNTIDTVGARAALRIELNDNWTLTPSIQTQKQEQEGSWGADLSDFVSQKSAVTHFRDEFSNDKWYQAGLTIEGKVGNFDLVYSGNYLNRDVDGSFDYTDYAYWYDVYYYSGSFAANFIENDGSRANPTQTFTNDDHYTKVSHELRISTPQDRRVRGLLGLFWQHQYHDFYQQYGNVIGLADVMLMNASAADGVVNGSPSDTNTFPGVVYLNSMDRHDRDKAVFGQIAFDITDNLELTLGARFFKPEVTVKGFFGYGLGFNPPLAPGSDPIDRPEDFRCLQFVADDCVLRDFNDPIQPGDPANGGDGAYSTFGTGQTSGGGEWFCASQVDYKDAPCLNVDKAIKESDHIGRVNLSWKATDTAMLYATWSEGYRPGGVQRNPFAGTFNADFLTNYEIGWKTRWADDRVQFNGAVFLEQWDDFQISFQGANGITQVANGPSAEIRGLETQLDWLATDKLRLSASMAFYDTELKDDYASFNGDGTVKKILAPKGTKLPVTPDFKGNAVARYTFPLGNFDAHVQGALSYQGSRTPEMDVGEVAVVGNIPANTFLDLSFGIENEKYSVELYVANATDEDSPMGLSYECDADTCGVQTYGIIRQPRTFGITFSQEF